jgi:hypothetical protein
MAKKVKRKGKAVKKKVIKILDDAPLFDVGTPVVTNDGKIELFDQFGSKKTIGVAMGYDWESEVKAMQLEEALGPSGVAELKEKAEEPAKEEEEDSEEDDRWDLI